MRMSESPIAQAFGGGAAGFDRVDCAFKAWQFAVYSGQRPRRE